MNYHKKLISIGFKRIPGIIVVEEDQWPYNEFIIGVSEYDKEKHKRVRYPYNPLAKTLRYKYKDIYIVVDKGEFCLLIESLYSTKIWDTKKVTHIKLKSKLSPSFWKEILDQLPSEIKREILIKNIIN